MRQRRLAAGYNWATVKADVNSGKLKGAALDKALEDMSFTLLAGIKMTGPTRALEYKNAIKTYLSRALNGPAPAAPTPSPTPGPATPARPVTSNTFIPPDTTLPAAAAHPNYIQTGTGGVKDIGLPVGVDSTYEQGVYNLATNIQNKGQLPAPDAKRVNDILTDIEQPGVTKQNIFQLLDELNAIAKRNNINTR